MLLRWIGLCAAGGCLSCALLPSAAQSALQRSVNQAMGGKRGTAIVLAVDAGQILAAYHLDVAARRRAFPGSSIKPFTLMALLERQAVDAHTSWVCKRPLNIAGHRLDCSHPATGQPLDAAAALAYSCNSYFTSLATRLTPAQLQESLIEDGFASATGLAPEEAAGNVALAASRDELQLQAIGDWGVQVTPLELLHAYRHVALRARGSGSPELAPVFDGLAGSTGYGMARLAQPDGNVRVAGKTGTANSDEGQWTHGWFAGYAPAETPEFVLVVFLEHGRGSDAADVARHIFGALGANEKAKPSLTAGRKP